jgi:CHC2 zinc finger
VQLKGEGLLFARGGRWPIKIEASPAEHRLATSNPRQLLEMAGVSSLICRRESAHLREVLVAHRTQRGPEHDGGSERTVSRDCRDQAQLPLLEVVERAGVRLKRSGSHRWQGLCPLHAERTASFFVDVKRQRFTGGARGAVDRRRRAADVLRMQGAR